MTSHKYILDGNKIVKETVTGNSAYTLYYLYDAAGSIVGFEYNGTTYYFQKNLQGDIIRICNISGNTVVEYTYDAWGKVTSITGSLASTVGQANPFRYRGYYYDVETEFYYLQTRYYDPEVGRFLNADGYVGANGGIHGYNMFAYCNNNPVVYNDPNGEFLLSVLAMCVIGGAVIGATVGGIVGNEIAKSKGYTGAKRAAYIVGGIFGGGFLGGLLGYVAAPYVATYLGFTAISVSSSGAVYYVSQNPEIHSSWRTAEDAARHLYEAVKKVFDTPLGRRYVDAYSDNIIREIKYGYQSLSSFIEKEIEKDLWILNNTNVTGIEWHFYQSAVSGTIGASDPLLQKLLELGIKVFFH